MKETPIVMQGWEVLAILNDKKHRMTTPLFPQPRDVKDECHKGIQLCSVCNDMGCCDNQVRFATGFEPGDRIWVQEEFDVVDDPTAYAPDEPRDKELDSFYKADHAVRIGPHGERLCVDYRADNPTRIMDRPHPKTGKVLRRWKPAKRMPRWAPRLILEVTAVRVCRLNDISCADAIDEGIERHDDHPTSITWKDYSGKFCGEVWDGWISPLNSLVSLLEKRYAKQGFKRADNPWVVVREFEVVSKHQSTGRTQVKSKEKSSVEMLNELRHQVDTLYLERVNSASQAHDRAIQAIDQLRPLFEAGSCKPRDMSVESRCLNQTPGTDTGGNDKNETMGCGKGTDPPSTQESQIGQNTSPTETSETSQEETKDPMQEDITGTVHAGDQG
jgi:hypothetical protein